MRDKTMKRALSPARMDRADVLGGRAQAGPTGNPIGIFPVVWRGLSWLVVLLVAGAWNPLLRENEHARKAAQLLRRGKAAKAVEEYRKAQKELGERPELQYDLGVALAAAGKDEDAEKPYLEASTKGDRKIRTKARYNLGNAYSRMAAKKAGEGTKALTGAFAILKKLGELPDKPTKEQCQQFHKAVLAYKKAGALFDVAKHLDQKAFFEYKEVLLRQSNHFKAKWNLELALRGIAQADSVAKQASRIEDEYAKKCGQKDKKNQDKKKNDSKNQDKKNPNKKNQDKKNQDSKSKDKKNQDSKSQDKKNQNQPNQKQNDQQKDKPQPQRGDKPQKQRREKDKRQSRLQQVERQLDRFERTQRKMQRQRMRGSMQRRRVVKDW